MEEDHSVISLENKTQLFYPVKVFVPLIICTGSRKVGNNRVFPCRKEQSKNKKRRNIQQKKKKKKIIKIKQKKKKKKMR